MYIFGILMALYSSYTKKNHRNIEVKILFTITNFFIPIFLFDAVILIPSTDIQHNIVSVLFEVNKKIVMKNYFYIFSLLNLEQDMFSFLLAVLHVKCAKIFSHNKTLNCFTHFFSSSSRDVNKKGIFFLFMVVEFFLLP